MKLGSKLGIFAIILSLLVGCNGYEKLMKGTDFEAKYQAAMRYYHERNYTKAIQLFENLILNYHGKENAEEIAWYYSQSLMQEHDYFTAGYQFKNFFKRYPYSKRAEEALYQAALCKYKESPEYYLDQKSTKEAIQEFESYLDRYPGSTHVPEINDMLDELREKLIHKDYEIAYNYYVTEQYHAAYVSLQSFISNYPESHFKTDAMYYMIASGYEYGINSQESKVKERLQQVVSDFDRFSSSLQGSQHLPKAQQIYTDAKAAIAKIEKNETKK